jgi:hypothetical protein
MQIATPHLFLDRTKRLGRRPHRAVVTALTPRRGVGLSGSSLAWAHRSRAAATKGRAPELKSASWSMWADES